MLKLIGSLLYNVALRFQILIVRIRLTWAKNERKRRQDALDKLTREAQVKQRRRDEVDQRLLQYLDKMQ